jgi:hypothetical protein
VLARREHVGLAVALHWIDPIGVVVGEHKAIVDDALPLRYRRSRNLHRSVEGRVDAVDCELCSYIKISGPLSLLYVEHWVTYLRNYK